ncbi:methyl-accepting chemotaxis protein [Chitinimonas koreensis]|uniref:methyl-accepting chemotaxis protein n=1 Tax=Chitinimonas koreensis TaxID=356302 RepID=UPI0003F6D08D|nr:methyl-accepting chemotaxis protein [Chitinimonas koreensis]QNM96255.1 methyl-accepting chemotaxis protein [Chitinimonas koreensis]
MFQRISHRLLLLIAVAMAGLWLAAGLGLYQLNRANQYLSELDHNFIPSIDKLNDATLVFSRIRVSLLYHILADAPQDKAEIEGQLERYRTELAQTLQSYESLVSDEEDRRMLTADHAAVDAYMADLPKLLELSRANDRDGAMRATATLRPLGLKAIDALQAHGDYNQKLTDRYVEEAAGNYRSTLIEMLVVSVLTSAVLAIAAFATYRKVVGTANRANQEVSRVVRELDFSRSIEVTGQDELSNLLRTFNSLIERLRDGFGTIRKDVTELASASEELASAAEQVRISSMSQADAAAAMAANVEQVTVSISHVSERTSEASSLSRSAGEQALVGDSSVQRTVGRIDAIASEVDSAAQELIQLEESGRKIGTVVGVIKEVADQTNLLALNAAIEAARAGEQGRGFAVVADEVRKLAERTALSTQEIAAMVLDIQNRSSSVSDRMARAVDSVRAGVSEGGSTRDAIQQIAVVSTQNSTLVCEIADALREQSTASNAIAGQVERVAQMSEENSRAAERSTELSTRLQELAATMQRMVLAYQL